MKYPIPPVYTLMFYNGIANGGKMIKPYIIAGISENGDLIEEFETEVITKQMCKPQTLKEMQQMLVDVVQQGTAHGRKAVSSDYVQIAGKTGTAQIHQGKAGYKGNIVRHRVSFCGYFPAENPKYSGIVVVSGSANRLSVGRNDAGCGAPHGCGRDVCPGIFARRGNGFQGYGICQDAGHKERQPRKYDIRVPTSCFALYFTRIGRWW